MFSDVTISPALNRFCDDLEVWFARGDRLLDKIIQVTLKKEKDEGNERTISCSTCTKPGCCYLGIYEPFVLTLHIARFLRTTGRDTPELREKLRDLGERMESMGKDAWFDTITPCAFLNERGHCTIYQIRPAACRSHVVVSPAEDCNPPSKKGVEIGHVATNEYNFAVLKQSQLAADFLGLKQTPMRILVGALPRVVYLGLLFLDEKDPVKAAELITKQPWPTVHNFDEWTQNTGRPSVPAPV